jgi:hypothetical protein
MTQIQITTLGAEAQRYLALVDLFRAEGCEPKWRRERVLQRSTPATARRPSSARGDEHDHD